MAAHTRALQSARLPLSENVCIMYACAAPLCVYVDGVAAAICAAPRRARRVSVNALQRSGQRETCADRYTKIDKE